MGYKHCEKHDCDATNGCVACEQEYVDGKTDAQILHEVHYRLGSYRYTYGELAEPLCRRLKQIAARLERESAPRAVSAAAVPLFGFELVREGGDEHESWLEGSNNGGKTWVKIENSVVNK